MTHLTYSFLLTSRVHYYVAVAVIIPMSTPQAADLVERTLDQVSESWILMLSLPPALPSLVILSDLSDL